MAHITSRIESTTESTVEYVLTVEADGYAPQHRHIKVQPEPQAQDFRLNAGRKVSNRVVDEKGKPVAGACVVLNRWHVHTDPHGCFHWSVQASIPEQVEVGAYRRYSSQYGSLKKTLALSQIESQPIRLPPKGEDWNHP